MLCYANLYHPQDAEEAYLAFRAHCGPAALAALLKHPVMTLWPALGNMEHRGYCTPSHLLRVLGTMGITSVTLNAAALRHRIATSDQPDQEPALYGLLFLQWTGPWSKPGVPVRAQYRHTHWVGTALTQEYGRMFYDINAAGLGNVWGDWVSCWWGTCWAHGAMDDEDP
jgi:hypothetical protein